MRRRTIVATIAGAAFVGLAVGVAPAIDLAPGYSGTVSGCRVTDGDTIRCGEERIRLLGIDAPELPGHCNRGRRCALGDPYASTANLRTAMVGQLRVERVGTDRYGRTLAVVAGGQGDLSCWQLSHGQALYRLDWDDELRVARACPSAAVG
jgi:micrococcal nuclease